MLTETLPNGIRVTGDLAKLKRLIEKRTPTATQRQAELAIILHLIMEHS